MSEHTASIEWRRAPSALDSSTYCRNHVAVLGGGQQLNVSASPEYKGDPSCADPEQMLVSAVASCHMLFFLAIAELKGFRVDSYRDTPAGYLEKNARGMNAVTRIVLRPEVLFGGAKQPRAAELERLHAAAHKNCFIANSVTAEVVLEPLPLAKAG